MVILVLMGGTSAERDVSLASGKAVAQGLTRAGHAATTYDFCPAHGRDLFDLVASPVFSDAEVVFIALHGGEGEDGRIQALLELAGKPYTGSGVRASAVCMDKAMTKIVFERVGVPTPPWAHLANGDEGLGEATASIRGLGGYPIVVKPVDQGSTIGISIVAAEADLVSAIALARRYSPGLLFEKYIPGKELSITVIGDATYPVVEIKPKEGFYDYERKYTKGATFYECPARLDPDVASRIQHDALKAYRALGCEGFGRVDLRLTPEGEPFFLEVNTIPGMTETSLVPMAASAGGMSFDRLVDNIARLALRRTRVANPTTGG